MDPFIVLFGLGVGILIGLTGVGGGSLMTPMLILVFKTQPVVAVGTDLAYGAITKTLGAWRHYRQGTVDVGLSLWLAVGSLPGAVVGVLAIEVIKSSSPSSLNRFILTPLGIALVLASLAVLVRSLFLRRRTELERDSVEMVGAMRVTAVALGVVMGAILGMTSVGSGALIGLALIMVFRLTPHRVIGTDVFHAAMLLWVAGLVHMAFGNVDFALTGNILVGSLPGVWIGSGIVKRVPTTVLRLTLGVVLFGSAIAILDKAGAIDVGVPGILGGPIVLAIFCVVALRLRRHDDDAPTSTAPPTPPADDAVVSPAPFPDVHQSTPTQVAAP